ncbi:MMPL family transporter [Nocardia sp. XZ_19_385]|uniref:MMPL family transporter n=1 Tax=Nocardia sp. XZ_19_385 TaxID=2769488 RepID=UPI00188F7355|nr:MMPL family transporter [Nocardia sp. XZ_19_385]
MAGTVRFRIRPLLSCMVVSFLLAVAAGLLLPDCRLAGGAIDPAADSALVAQEIGVIAPQAAPNLFLLVSTPGGVSSVDDPRVSEAGRRLAAALAATDGVTGVVSAWTLPVATLRSMDGRSGLVLAHIEGDEAVQDRTLAAVRARLPDVGPGISVRLGGPAAVRAEVLAAIKADLIKAEVVAVPLVLIILLIVFGGFTAALLPIAVGVFSIVTTDAALKFLSQFTEVSIFSQNLTTAVGLGLAVDYALLLVRRFREELVTAESVDAAVERTVATAGRTVLVSAATFAAVVAVLMLFPMYFLRSFAYAGVVVVAISTFAALVFLPEALRVVGHRIGARRPEDTAPDGGRWARWTRRVLRRPWVFGIASMGLLVSLAAPFGSVLYGTMDDRQLPPGADMRATHDMLRSDFDSAALPIVQLTIPADMNLQDVHRISSELREIDDVTSVAPPPLLAEPKASSAARNRVLLVSARNGIEPTSAQGQALVAEIQRVARDHDIRAGGEIATLLDTKAALAGTAPIAAVLVIAVALLATFVLTGSVTLAVVSVLLNGMSLTASLGAIVLVFQQGHLSGLLGFTPTGVIDTTLPILIVCIAFGLSMDYGVFVMARLTEERQLGAAHGDAIVRAIQRTGGIITSAAAILTIVLLAIGASRVAATKMVGLGVALAAVVDASIVRLILVPAVLGILGERVWWAPQFLLKVAARISCCTTDSILARDGSVVRAGVASPATDRRSPLTGNVDRANKADARKTKAW